MTYGLIVWGNSHYSNIIFRLQKRIIRIIVWIRGRDSCRGHFKKLQILSLKSQYILSLLLFVVDNGDCIKVNPEIHNISTRNNSNLHPPISNLSLYRKGTYYSGIRVSNILPSQIKDLFHNRSRFNRALKNFLYFINRYLLWQTIVGKQKELVSLLQNISERAGNMSEHKDGNPFINVITSDWIWRFLDAQYWER